MFCCFPISRALFSGTNSITALRHCCKKNFNKNDSDKNTAFMERSPSSEAVGRYPGKEIPRILWQPKLNDRVNSRARSYSLS